MLFPEDKKQDKTKARVHENSSATTSEEWALLVGSGADTHRGEGPRGSRRRETWAAGRYLGLAAWHPGPALPHASTRGPEAPSRADLNDTAAQHTVLEIRTFHKK